MIAAALFLTLAAGNTVDWSPTINTFLLVVLAIVSLIGERYRKQEARQVKRDLNQKAERIEEALEREAYKVKAALDERQKEEIVRDPNTRTRSTDE